jgi:hypothetical protein
MCKCKNGITESDRYAQQIVLTPPFIDYTNARIAQGLSPSVCIDPCIAEEIIMLWNKGILTLGCCCGRNQPPMYPFVNVADEHIEQMLDMGYIQQHWDADRKDTFRLKSFSE